MDRRRIGGALELDDVVYGIHAVAESLRAGEPLRVVHVARDRRDDQAVRRLIDAARDHRVPVRFEDRRYFVDFPYKAHQGVVAFAEPFEYAALTELLARRRESPALFVMLDHVTDPHNAGAILRTAECVRSDGVILPERRSAGINPTVRKAAAGAAAHLPIARVVNLSDALRRLKKAGIWIVGADAAAGAIEVFEADLRGDLALVIGAEDRGLSTLVRRECDFRVRIPTFGKVASLNASVAAGVVLYEALRQRSSSDARRRQGDSGP